jgi:hypothetical protein
MGDLTRFTGAERSIGYRWFVDAANRAPYPPDEAALLSRVYASGLRELVAVRGPGSPAAQLADALLETSAEFRRVWGLHEVGLQPPERKRFAHPEIGIVELSCQTLLDPEQSHRLLVYTATPGSDSYAKLQLLSVIGAQTVA